MAKPEAVEVPVNDVIFDPTKYPRHKWDGMVVASIRAALDTGEIPPIEINANKYLVDGVHRLQAHKMDGRATITAFVLDIPDDKVLWEASRRNSTHGKQLTLKEKEDLAKVFYKENNHSETDIATTLAVSIGSISGWVSSIRREREDARNARIHDLYLRCWTEQQIAEEVGLGKSQVDNIISNFFTDEKGGNPPDSLQIYNIWEFAGADDGLGEEGYPGRMPGQIVENLLWYFTEPFDLVVDPMAGGGTTLDVCLEMNRRCLCYDLNSPRIQEVVEHDITAELPKLPPLRRDGQLVKPKLLLLDPPYWRQRKNDYTQEDTNLACMPLDRFHNTLLKIINESHNYIRPDGYIALIMSQTRFDNIVYDHIATVLNQLNMNKWSIIERIIVPYTTQQALNYHVVQAQEGRYMLRLYRDLLILQPKIGGPQ